MFEFAQRPSRSHDDDDLLQLMGELQATNVKPSSSVNTSSAHPKLPRTSTATLAKNTSIQNKDAGNDSLDSVHSIEQVPKNSNELSLESDNVHFEGVLKNVSERIVTDEYSEGRPLVFHATGFPVATYRTESKFKAKMAAKTSSSVPNDINSYKSKGVDRDIHRENLERIKQLSATQLESTRGEVLDSISSKGLEFLRKRSMAKYEQKDALQAMQPAIIAAPVHAPTKSPTKKYPEFQLGESEKVAWMASSTTDNASSQLRFDFKGTLVNLNVSIPGYMGLDHHGKNPESSGYSIQELVHLSKSTVPSQRAIAFQTISKIIQNVFDGNFETAGCKIMKEMDLNDILLSIRVGLDSLTETVVEYAIHCLATYLGCNTRLESGIDFQHILYLSSILPNGQRSLALSVESLTAFKGQALGRSIDPEISHKNETLKEIISLMDKDCIDGLLQADILIRFRYMFDTKPVSSDAEESILRILCVFAAHSTSAAEDILACPGLVDAIRNSLFRLPFPPPEGSEQSIFAKLALRARVFRLIAGTSREACQAILKHHLVHDMMRFLAFLPQNTSSNMQLIGEVLGVLSQCFVFGLGGPIIDDYRQLFFDLAQILKGRIIKSETFEICRLEMLAWSSLMNCVRNALISFRQPLDPGGEHDAFLPVLECAKAVVCVGNKASKLLEHISADSKALIGQLTESVKGLSMPPILSTTILENAITDEIKEKGRGLITKIRISQAFDILSIDSSLMQNEAHLDLLRVLVSGGFLAIEDIKSRTKMLFPSIQTCIAGDSIEHHDWIRFFSQGCGALCKTWLHTIQLIMKHSNGCEFSESAMYSIVNHCISRLLPGDDACGFDLAQQFFASKTYTKDGTSISIRDVYENLMTLKENVNYSRSLFGAEDAGKPSCLRIEVHQGISSYPLRLDWIYSPIAEYLERQSKQLDNDNVALKSFAILSFAREMEDSSALISPANKLANMMHIFLLCDSNGDELFRDSAMQGILDWGLRKYCINGGCNLENAFSLLKAGQIATQSRFYELYQELVNQYLAVSFGDGVFSNYLAIALTMDYPVDYRLYFWTAMGPMVRSIFWTEKDLPGQNVKKYIEPIETNAELLDMYRHALNSGAVSAKVNPVLFKIASHHLRK